MNAVGRKASLLAFSVMSLFIGMEALQGYCVVLNTAGWTLLMAASQAWQLYAGRLLLGLGAGLQVTIAPVYILETTRPDMRNICRAAPRVPETYMCLLYYVCGTR